MIVFFFNVFIKLLLCRCFVIVYLFNTSSWSEGLVLAARGTVQEGWTHYPRVSERGHFLLYVYCHVSARTHQQGCTGGSGMCQSCWFYCEIIYFLCHDICLFCQRHIWNQLNTGVQMSFKLTFIGKQICGSDYLWNPQISVQQIIISQLLFGLVGKMLLPLQLICLKHMYKEKFCFTINIQSLIEKRLANENP